jgi:hypothetical protein
MGMVMWREGRGEGCVEAEYGDYSSSTTKAVEESYSASLSKPLSQSFAIKRRDLDGREEGGRAWIQGRGSII